MSTVGLPGTARMVSIWELGKVIEVRLSAGEVRSNTLTRLQVALLLHTHTIAQLPTLALYKETFANYRIER